MQFIQRETVDQLLASRKDKAFSEQSTWKT